MVIDHTPVACDFCVRSLDSDFALGEAAFKQHMALQEAQDPSGSPELGLIADTSTQTIRIMQHQIMMKPLHTNQ